MSTSFQFLANNATPTGTIIWFSSNAIPTGFLKANGAAISRTTYSSLFSVIGTTFGAGDGSTTFLVPDMRGVFTRGWSSDSTVWDSGRTFGSIQQQDWLGFYLTDTVINTSSGYSHGPVFMGNNTTGTYIGNLFTGKWKNPSGSIGVMWDSSEIRPDNVALLACIKT